MAAPRCDRERRAKRPAAHRSSGACPRTKPTSRRQCPPPKSSLFAVACVYDREPSRPPSSRRRACRKPHTWMVIWKNARRNPSMGSRRAGRPAPSPRTLAAGIVRLGRRRKVGAARRPAPRRRLEKLFVVMPREFSSDHGRSSSCWCSRRPARFASKLSGAPRTLGEAAHRGQELGEPRGHVVWRDTWALRGCVAGRQS